MFDIVRKLLDEAEKIDTVPDQPPFKVKPIPIGCSVVGVVPLEIRRFFVLARFRAGEVLNIARAYEDAVEIPVSVMLRVRTLQNDMALLEGNAETLLDRLFFEETGGRGNLTIHEGWQVAWDPTEVEEECDCDECEAEEVPDPSNRTLN
jgi:hypothetical protein